MDPGGGHVVRGNRPTKRFGAVRAMEDLGSTVTRHGTAGRRRYANEATAVLSRFLPRAAGEAPAATASRTPTADRDVVAARSAEAQHALPG